jgi:molybdopterin adenylyltransferase
MMPGIDSDAVFHPLHIAILTISDTRTLADDTSGALLAERIVSAGHRLVARAIVADDVGAIQTQIGQWVDGAGGDIIDVVLTTGGTGFSARDVTPEAVRPLLRREMEGFAVLFHQASMTTVGLSTLQSRAFAGQIADSFIFCLPGSTGACRDAWDMILGAELDSRYRPCSLATMIPRLQGTAA